MAEPLIVWLDVFVDVPPQSAVAFRAFWAAVTGWSESAPRGDRGQFRSLLPVAAPDFTVVDRAYLRIQELPGAPRVHLDLVSSDLAADRDRLIALGARRVDSLDGVEILASPAGQVCCLVRDDEPRPAVPPEQRAHEWPGGHRSRFTHPCLDVPAEQWESELEFWSAATGWPVRPSSSSEFAWLLPPDDLPLKVLVQRLAGADDALHAHLDLGTTDVAAEVTRLLRLGALDVGPADGWHVLRDPALGLPFCVTQQQP